jgi:hypothetical protein
MSLVDIRERLFGGDDDMRNVILWYRPKAFNRLALKMVVQRMLEQQGHAEMELHVPGVLSSQPATPLPVLQPWPRYPDPEALFSPLKTTNKLNVELLLDTKKMALGYQQKAVLITP